MHSYGEPRTTQGGEYENEEVDKEAPPSGGRPKRLPTSRREVAKRRKHPGPHFRVETLKLFGGVGSVEVSSGEFFGISSSPGIWGGRPDFRV